MHISDRIGRRLKLNDLHVLMAVVQAGSMGKAATLLNTGQPAISRSIAALEHAVGVKLLDRTHQGIEPTVYGRALLDGGAAVFDDLRRTVKNIEFLADPTVGELRVGSNEAMIAGLIPTVSSRIRRDHPGISIRVTPLVNVAQRYRELRERRLDLVLGRMTNSNDDDIAAEVLFHDRMLVVAGSQSKWARRRKIELAELADEPWCMPPPNSQFGTFVADTFWSKGIKFPPKGAVFGTVHLSCALLAREPFVSIFPTSMLRLGTNLPPLKVLPVNLPIPPWPVGMLSLKDRTVAPVVRLFVNSVRDVVRPLRKSW